MNWGLKVLGGIALAVCSASAAQAAKVLATAPVLNGTPVVQTMYCDIVNLNPAPTNMMLEIMDLNGTVVGGPFGPFTLQPDEGFALAEFTGTGAWCRFTVDGSPKKWRALAVYDDGTNYTAVINAQ